MVKLLRGVSASQQRCLWDGEREDRGPRGGQVQEGNWVRGMVAGMSWRTCRGLVERRGRGLSREAGRDSVDCRGIRSGGGGCGGCWGERWGWKR